MRNNRAIAVTAVIVSLLGGLIFGLVRSPEPEYRGEPLCAWLNEAASLRQNPGNPFSDQAQQEQIAHAVRQIGTNALPNLLTMIRAKDGPIKKNLFSWLLAWRASPFHPTTENEHHLLALLGFTILGPVAKPAVPALVDLLADNDGETAFLAASALGRIGPAASNAVPALIMNLDNQDFAVRYMATNSLRRIYPAAVLGLPVGDVSA